MSVLRMVRGSNEQTVRVLRGLLARAEKNQVLSVAVCVLDGAGEEYHCLTGSYRRRGMASNAGFTLQCLAAESGWDP